MASSLHQSQMTRVWSFTASQSDKAGWSGELQTRQFASCCSAVHAGHSTRPFLPFCLSGSFVCSGLIVFGAVCIKPVQLLKSGMSLCMVHLVQRAHLSSSRAPSLLPNGKFPTQPHANTRNLHPMQMVSIQLNSLSLSLLHWTDTE